ncbi:MAG TPA: PQQ-dependent sugar dehydrogenase [Blastocatellia bacterium]|nr:PQQ-dependent sugar dehydrogenase [Blastocatellia bacterium]
MKSTIHSTAVLLVMFVLGCGQVPPGKGEGEVGSTAAGNTRFRVETFAGGLEVPWSIAFAPDRRVFLTERPGRVRVIENGKLRAEPLATLGDVVSEGENGLMGLALHPQFQSNHLLYVAYTYGEGNRVRVVRFRETKTALADRNVIIEDIPAATIHAGCRLRFGPDGKLYITTGDAARREQAQRLDSLGGKILRLNDDGTIPTDNPFVNQQRARGEIWSYGHRNPQGLDWQPRTNLMFDTEHGPSGFDGPGGGDEINIVEKGKNYGWPVIHHQQTKEGMESPLLEYTPSVAPASGMFYRGSAFAEFRGNFFFGCLRGRALVRVVLDGRKVVSQERLIDQSFGRIREVAEGPDGAIYFSTSNRDGRGRPAADDDRIIRLVPVK